MNCNPLFLIFILLSGLNAHAQEEPQGLTWEFAKRTRDIHGRELQGNITYSISSEITKIDDGHESIYIDYSKHVLYKFSKSDKSCRTFPFISSNGNNSAKTGKVSKNGNISLISSLRVFTTTQQKEIAHYDCSVRHILFGADLAMHQMVSSPVVREFGRNFTEVKVDYCVSKEVAGLKNLLNIAQKRSNVFKNNPLLRQVDIIGLLEVLEGFPVQITSKDKDIDSVMTLQSHPAPIADMTLFQLPDECGQ